MRGLEAGVFLLLAVTIVTAQDAPVLISETEPKIICLYSKELRNGMDFTAFCTLTKPASEDVSVFVSLRVTQETTSNLAFTNSMFTITIGAGNLHGSGTLPISYDLTTGATYFIHTSFIGLRIKPWSEQISGYRPELPYFIITDKPVYNPGDDVLIRGLTCDMYLKPTSTSATIEIKDSKKNSIMKETSSNNLKTGFPSYARALIDTNFTLSDDPLTGMYTVSLYTDEGYVERQFEVKEFVLPRFEVKIELETQFLVSGNDEIKGVIKGIYSYGKNVQGRAQIKLTGPFRFNDDEDVAWSIDAFDGRAEFTVKVDEKKFPIPWFGDYVSSGTTVVLQGEVIEANSNDVQSVEVSVNIYPTDFTAKLGPMPLLFKGNPQYTFPVALTNPLGGMLKDVEGYTLYYKAIDDKDFSKMTVSSNPMTVTVRMNTSDLNLYSNKVQVYFAWNEIKSPLVTQEVTKYYTWSNTTLKVEMLASQSKVSFL
ncbi:alpha-2-macroglobulin-like isoform X2 [Ruditapes philippinarum]|nr:alpha-2-macroglobulin-like isoform X2 [Ruditapes philippinarum]XP_060553867.1 alpha-2-macroglobulin-like isoform X2 [Ruditapes philippinarum]